MDLSRHVQAVCDLSQPVKPVRLGQALFQGEQNALTLDIALCRNGDRVSPAGAAVIALVNRADGSTLTVTGSVSGDTATVILPQEACAMPGQTRLLVRLAEGESVRTIWAAEGVVMPSDTEPVYTAGEPLPTLDGLLAAMSRCQQAASSAEEAAALAGAQTAALTEALSTLEDTMAAYALPFTAAGVGEVRCHPAEGTRVRLSLRLTAYQAGEGAPSPDNIRPLSALTACTLTQSGEGETVTQTVELPAAIAGADLDWTTGALAVNGTLLTLTGQENVEYTVVGGFHRFAIDLGQAGYDLTRSNGQGRCSHFALNGMPLSANGNAMDLAAAVGGKYLYVRCDALGSAAQMRAYLTAQAEAGTPVQICLYRTATETHTLTGLTTLRGLCGENVFTMADAELTVCGTLDAGVLLERLSVN